MGFISHQVQEELMVANKVERSINFEDYIEEINRFGLQDHSLSIQNHFLSVRENLKECNINVQSWERVSYEIRYVFERDGETAGFKFWVNGKNIFKDSYAKLPSSTNSGKLFEEIENLLAGQEQVIVVRSNDDSDSTFQEFDKSIEEDKPFLKSLYDNIICSLKNGLRIVNLEHLEYRERYTIAKDGNSIKVDFEYNKSGFFGRVLPIGNEKEVGVMQSDIKEIIAQLKS